MTWPIPPEDGYFAEDLDTIPDLPPHTELIDGSLVFVSPQVIFHKRAILFLWKQLAEAAPSEFAAHVEMTVTLGPKQRPEPDVLIYELDPATKQYVAIGIHHDRLTASWPFPIDLDLSAFALPEN